MKATGFSILLCGTLACAVKTENAGDTSAVVSDSAARVTTIDTTKTAPAPPPVAGTTTQQQPPAQTIDRARPSAGTSFTIAPNSFGPLRVGMTVAQAAKAMGGGFGAPAGYSGGCGYAVLVKAPKGLAVMLDQGKIARFEVRSGGIATTEGARIGDTEARIKSLYGSAVTSAPHKYLQGGHYLTVTPPAGAEGAYKIIFETDGKQVTEFRSGKSPEVEQVERCG
jgi:hypothetical protein